jgi:ATP-dependent RNA circularization protein (DNA/RNA ligase family)
MAQIIKADGSSLGMGKTTVLEMTNDDVDKLQTKRAVLEHFADKMRIVRWEETREVTPRGRVIRLKMEALILRDELI